MSEVSQWMAHRQLTATNGRCIHSGTSDRTDRRMFPRPGVRMAAVHVRHEVRQGDGAAAARPDRTAKAAAR